MVFVNIDVSPEVAEYAAGKYADPDTGAVHFPAGSDIYITLFDLLQKRPAVCPVDRGNLRLALPCRREGKNPAVYNYLAQRSAAIINDRLRTAMWAELHEAVDQAKHVQGIQIKEAVWTFMTRYGIESISEDAMLKNYQRWRAKVRMRAKRAYNRRK